MLFLMTVVTMPPKRGALVTVSWAIIILFSCHTVSSLLRAFWFCEVRVDKVAVGQLSSMVPILLQMPFIHSFLTQQILCARHCQNDTMTNESKSYCAQGAHSRGRDKQ